METLYSILYCMAMCCDALKNSSGAVGYTQFIHGYTQFIQGSNSLFDWILFKFMGRPIANDIVDQCPKAETI